MIVHRVVLNNVGVQVGSREVIIPATGTLLVTGPNGSGKSSTIEAVALALWGESLRGVPLWRDGVAGEVVAEVVAGGHTIVATRSRTKAGRTSLTFTVDAAPAVAIYETSTKAQEALTLLVGTFGNWRRTHVLSSSDSAAFSAATDAERKRLLENLLGLDRLDRALVSARAEVVRLDGQMSIDDRALAHGTAEMTAALNRRHDAEVALEALVTSEAGGDPVALAAEITRLKLAGEVAADEARDVSAALSAVMTSEGSASSTLGHVARRRDRVDRDTCPTCEQAVSDDHRCRIRRELDLEEVTAQKALDAAKVARRSLETTRITLDSECRGYTQAVALATGKRTAALSAANLRATLTTQRDSATKAHGEAEVNHDELCAAFTGSVKLVAVARAAAGVLGMRGVRAHLLDVALAETERVACGYLAALSSTGARLELRSTTATKAGGTSESLSLRVSVRAGEPLRAYGSLSGGERRRVDVALLLALADAARAAAGNAAGTLWLDEVFDALDADGVAAVGSLVTSLASMRGVVLVTHAPDLAASIAGATRLDLGDT